MLAVPYAIRALNVADVEAAGSSREKSPAEVLLEDPIQG